MKFTQIWQRVAAVDRAVWMTAAGAAPLALCAMSSWTTHPSVTRSVVVSGELLLAEELFVLDSAVRLAVWLGGVFFLLVAWRRWRISASPASGSPPLAIPGPMTNDWGSSPGSGIGLMPSRLCSPTRMRG